jgi:hypothetical protein
MLRRQLTETVGDNVPMEPPEKRIQDQHKTPRTPWPKADETRWVQWRIRERLAIEAGVPNADPTSITGKFRLTDYQAWLLHQADGFLELSPEAVLYLFPGAGGIDTSGLPLSFQRVGDLIFPDVEDPDNRKRRAAAAFNRVESEFHRGTLKRN